MTLWGCLHLMQFELEVVVDIGRGGRVLKSGLTFGNPLIISKASMFSSLATYCNFQWPPTTLYIFDIHYGRKGMNSVDRSMQS